MDFLTTPSWGHLIIFAFLSAVLLFGFIQQMFLSYASGKSNRKIITFIALYMIEQMFVKIILLMAMVKILPPQSASETALLIGYLLSLSLDVIITAIFQIRTGDEDINKYVSISDDLGYNPMRSWV